MVRACLNWSLVAKVSSRVLWGEFFPSLIFSIQLFLTNLEVVHVLFERESNRDLK